MTSKILCIDLDGTLIRTDITFIYIKHLMKHNIGKLLFSFCFSKLKFKENISKNTYPKIDKKIFIQETIDFVNKQTNTHKVLVTGAHKNMVMHILNMINIKFDEILYSDKELYVGKSKANLLLSKYRNFSYIGNEIRDRHIWKFSQKKIAVVKKSSLKTKILKYLYGKKINFIYY